MWQAPTLPGPSDKLFLATKHYIYTIIFVVFNGIYYKVIPIIYSEEKNINSYLQKYIYVWTSVQFSICISWAFKR